MYTPIFFISKHVYTSSLDSNDSQLLNTTNTKKSHFPNTRRELQLRELAVKCAPKHAKQGEESNALRFESRLQALLDGMSQSNICRPYRVNDESKESNQTETM